MSQPSSYQRQIVIELKEINKSLKIHNQLLREVARIVLNSQEQERAKRNNAIKHENSRERDSL